MKIVCAPDSFKETLTAEEAARAMAAGVQQADSANEPVLCPVGDGGEGTMDALLAALGGSRRSQTVTGPRCEPIKADFGITPRSVGIVELARASGLALLTPDQRNPIQTTTFGTGELIRAAADAGCQSIIVCIGGSATCDGGAGLAQALGTRFLNSAGAAITEPLTGGTLHHIARIEPCSDLPPIRVACDVTNPLLGRNGAAAVYGPQKGATPTQVDELNDALKHLASLTDSDTTFPGAGAAGGAGFGLVAFCNAVLKPGIDLVLDAVGFQQHCADADLVLTGEGQLDAQSLSGKAVCGVAHAAAHYGVPTIAIVGNIGPGAEQCTNRHTPPGPLRGYVSLTERFGNDRAKHEAEKLLREITMEVVQIFSSSNEKA